MATYFQQEVVRMVIRYVFPQHLQQSPFSQRTQHLRRLGQQMKKTKVCVTLGTEWNFLVLFFQTEAI